MKSNLIPFKVSPGERVHVLTPKQQKRARRSRLVMLARRWLFRPLQLVTGVHRIHHIRWGFGLKLPFSSWARFYSFVPRGEARAGEPRVTARWERVDPSDYHDCTSTGRY